MNLVVKCRSVVANPSTQELESMVSAMPNATRTEFGNYNVAVIVTARSKASTYVVTDSPQNHTDQTITRSTYAEYAKLQDDYIAQHDMLVIDGFIGPDPKTRTAARLIIEKSNANIAAMQRQLYFTPTAEELKNFEPELNVIYTPNLKAQGFPNDRLIAVDLDHGITRVFNSDYFGESKKGGLRMWNKLIYDRGGLAMHAGCKILPMRGQDKACLIVGLSGTGKTTTTFTLQNGSKPVQDDFIALLPDGTVLGTENGCFAKTYGLDAKSEPMIYAAVTNPAAYLENVSVTPNGRVDFHDTSFTANGRATFPFSLIEGAGEITEIPPVGCVLILNRNDNIIPAVAKLNRVQAAAYFCLGETQGTSAGGKEEAGKALRVPGTNPFFPLLHGLQGVRFYELCNKLPFEVYLMNTGWVGGPKGTAHSSKVTIEHSSAIVQGIADGTIQWATDPDFGYEIATTIPGFGSEDERFMNPKAFYEQTGRRDEYANFVSRYKTERAAHLRTYPSVTEEIIAAVS